MGKVTYTDKENNVINNVTANKKVSASDLNELKNAINALYDIPGWATYTDTGNSLVITTTPTLLTIDKSTSDEEFLPLEIRGSGTLYNANWFASQLIRLIHNPKGIFVDKGVQHVCMLLVSVFVLCGNSKWMGCNGQFWNDLPLAVCQYLMIIMIEFNFKTIKTIQSKEQADSIVTQKDSQIRNLIDQVFAGDDVKDWFFHQSLHGSVNSKGFFVMISDKWTNVLGWSKKELTTKPFIEFVHPEDREETLRIYNQGQKKDYDGYFYNRYQRKDGTYVKLKWPNETKQLGKDIFTFKAEVSNG